MTRLEVPPRLSQLQAERYLGCTPELLKRLRQARKVKCYRLGHRSISYDRASLDAYLASVCCEPRLQGGGR